MDARGACLFTLPGNFVLPGCLQDSSPHPVPVNCHGKALEVADTQAGSPHGKVVCLSQDLLSADPAGIEAHY